MKSDSITVQRTIAATPEVIFAYLSDAAKHQQIDGSGSLRGPKGDSVPLTMGTTFGMSMHMGANYSTVNEIVEFEQGRRIAWKTTGFKGLIGGRIWRYELEPTTEGTVVKETWDISDERGAFLVKRTSMPAATEKAMRKTLERISELVETT
ncbi:SRPBCC family protein [Aeromicrobium sp. CF3.5]|uniref:SRPBCC family protein n=1 Tax=Aeromicrobium sp. CF3.5 TaxID=3373078 RepID=UPI003EE4CD95